ncbi:MAG: alpha/beta fold hydrolase [Actinomycetes bacterium]
MADDLRVPSAAELAAWGLDPAWSTTVTFPGADGSPVTWHVLDTGPAPAGTVVCVHGNPTWGYTWRHVLAALAGTWRVIAVDQTGMGYSERGRPRRLAQRIDELVTFCATHAPGPVVLVAHDWGGPVAVGAAERLEVEALMLCNTAVAKPDTVRVPPLIAAARSALDLTCRRTPTFVAGTARMTVPEHRPALRAPYAAADRREAVRDFVADIPLGPDDPSFAALAEVAETFGALRCPLLLVWGGRDPVFHDGFLADLRARAPRADVERYPDCGHLSPLDPRTGPVVAAWLTRTFPLADASTAVSSAVPTDASTAVPPDLAAAPPSPLLAALAATPGLVYSGPDGALRGTDLAARSDTAAAVLAAAGLCAGDRVAVLVPPSGDLLVTMAAIWKRGAVAVVADASGGPAALRRLLRAQAPRFAIGTATTLAVAKAGAFTPRARMAAFTNLPGVVDLRIAPPGAASAPAAPPVTADAVAAIVHTSGATGPAKAVRYTHGALGAQLDAVRQIVGDDGRAFTSSFGPFMLLAPLLGMPFVRVPVRGDAPSRFGFDELVRAAANGSLGAAWLSPASARRIVATAAGRTVPVGVVMLAGAPIGPDLAAAVAAVTGGDVRAPYGMTECLPVTDGTNPAAIGPHGGTATGRPLRGATVEVVALPGGETAGAAPVWGELVVHAPWMFDGYEGAWAVNEGSALMIDGRRFHRTGDVGYVHDGVVFHLGRLAHVLTPGSGPVASVAIEAPVVQAVGVPVAAVGVGPAGAQVCVVVVEAGDAPRSLHLADADRAAAVRAATPLPVAAVLTGRLPVDHRHHSKIDRVALGGAVARFLAGR